MMMRIVVGLCIAIFFLGSNVRGADDLGVYFDENAETNCISPTSYPALMNAYVLYSNPSVCEIVGFELGVRIYQIHGMAPLVFSAQAPCSLAVADLAQVSVLCPEPIPCNTHTTLLTIPMFWWGGLTEIAPGAPLTPSMPITGPFVVLRDGSGLPVGRYPSWGVLDAGFDICHGLPIEVQAWGSIKGLYR